MKKRKLPALVINGCDVDEGKTVIIYKLFDSAIVDLVNKHSVSSDDKAKSDMAYEFNQLLEIKKIIVGDV